MNETGTPAVSVVLPTYNRAYCIEETISSILEQTFTDFELVVVDDGSTDNTEAVVLTIKDPRIRYVKCEKNGGIAAAFARCLTEAKGRYIARMDSDDLWRKDKLQIQYDLMEAHPELGACFSYTDLIDADGTLINEKYPDVRNAFRKDFTTQEEWLRYFFTTGNALNNMSAFMRSSVVSEVGLPSPLFWNNEDFEYWVRVVSRYPIYVIPEELTSYRWIPGGDQLSENDEQKIHGVMNLMVKLRYHFFDHMSDDDFIRWFGKDFRNKNSRTPLELACEKAFLQTTYPYHGSDMSIVAVYLLEKILADPEGARVLEETYHFGYRELYDLRKKHSVVELPGGYNLENRLKLTEQHARNLENMLSDIQNSGSYRLARNLSRVKGKITGK